MSNFPKQNYSDFGENDWIGFQKYFNINDYNTMLEIDEELLDFTKDFMNKLK